ncbi:5'/3'-nucleotidase SurE [Treponema sp.]|uniref:5'/3'-nucleotidase SurE n=1 Tax=Treponema sp. TaxID=166 RepID=UPI0025F7EF68|nr:5'/3'-nucleotidase SurE [Treponema sp.]MCR5218765.1 5'/3'-nucleotidase SurE [Treponema sp.]
MNILLTNDDGYGAAGLEALYDALSEYNDLTVIAPASNRSGYSARITMNRKLELVCHGKNRYSLDGSPVDCVIAGLRSDLCGGIPDLVISGINHGYNLGTDIIYSGTCGAAKQACVNGIPALALSVEGSSFKAMASFASKNLELLCSLCGGKSKSWGNELEYFVNVNGTSLDAYKGVQFTSLCYRSYNDNVIAEKEDSRTFFSITGGGSIVSEGSEDNDYIAAEKGYISVSLVSPGPGLNRSPQSCSGNFIL